MDMITNYISKIKVAFGALALVLAFSSCDDTNEWDVDSSYNRSFRPTSLASSSVTANTAELTWGAIPGTEKYILELSRDSMEFTNIVGNYESTEASYSLSDLEGSSEYSVRVKAKPSNPEKEESAFASVYFKTKSEQIMETVKDADRSATTVTLRWSAGKAVTKLVVKDSQGNVVEEFALNSENVANGSLLVENLLPQTSYVAEIYNGENRRGSISFVTFPEVPAAEHIVYWNAGDVVTQEFFDDLGANHGNVTIAIPAGAYFGISEAIVIPDGLSLHFFGLPGASKAVMSQNLFTLSAAHTFLKFTNLEITGIGYDETGAETGATYNYLINQTLAANVGNIEFENCELHDFKNCVIRLQGAETKYIGTLSFNNCTSYNFPDSYYFVNNNVANSVIDNILVTNSTFYSVSRFIVHSASNNNAITISDCTFNNILGSGRYFIDFSAGFQSANLTLANTILGATQHTGAKGIRAAKAASVINCYATTDWVLGSNAIAGLTSYGKSSTELFADPSNGDFTIIDDTFEGRDSAGDPKWRIE